MKNKLSLFLAIIVIAGCKTTVQEKPVDITAIKDSVKVVMDKYAKAFNDKNIDAFTALLADDILALGTDPNEFWNKKEITEIITQQFTLDLAFTYDKQEFRIAPDGKSAIVVNQYFVPKFSSKVSMREVVYLDKTDKGWLIKFVSSAFIPKNEDIEKINKALE